jgi:hypothetical protein
MGDNNFNGKGYVLLEMEGDDENDVRKENDKQARARR